VFVAGLAIIVLAFIATLFIREVALRQTAHVAAGRSQAAGVGTGDLTSSTTSE
jgi:hypothetical protein